MRVSQGFFGNKGTGAILQWEHGKKIVGNTGTSNAPGNTGTGTKTMIAS